MNRYEGSNNWHWGLARDLHRDNYMYVVSKDNKLARMGNHMIWRSQY
jgi:hypothetical protein